MSFVSCVCPTYNRFPDNGWLVGEAVESFLRQDYPAGRRELIVLNDAPGQTLACDAPGVRVVNLPSRVASLGEKYNLMVALARGELVCPWEDDDISLPWRISRSVERIGTAPYWNPKGYFFLPYRDGEPQKVSVDHAIGVGHNCSVYRRSAWGRVGGYPSVSGAQDAEMDRRLAALDGSIVERAPVEQWGYVYRWGVHAIHLSGRQPHDRFYADIGEMPVARGTFTIEPAWRLDYFAVCNGCDERR